jgi:hypothetical protein
MRGAIPPLSQYVFMAWCLVKHRDTYIFYLLPQPGNFWICPRSFQEIPMCFSARRQATWSYFVVFLSPSGLILGWNLITVQRRFLSHPFQLKTQNHPTNRCRITNAIEEESFNKGSIDSTADVIQSWINWEDTHEWWENKNLEGKDSRGDTEGNQIQFSW